jgi:uncharacterized protein (TIGR02996 family)
MTADEKGFLAAIKKNPKDATARGAYADWLDEHDRPYEALLQREKAGLSEVRYKLRRKSDGLYSEGSGRKAVAWSMKGKAWRKLSDLHGHLKLLLRDRGRYAATPGADLEVVVVEFRAVVAATLPVALEKVRGPFGTVHLVTIAEPLGGDDAG